MTKTFQKTLIAAAAGVALMSASMIASAGTPGTTNLLFPYVTTATGSFTFLSIVAKNGNAAAPKVHLTYATKAITAPSSTTCAHLDGDATMTPNDLMQFEMSNRADMVALFGDTTSVPKYFPGNTAAGIDRHGMLVVNNDVAAGGLYGGAAAYLNAPLYGEARIINTASGLALGYSTDDLHTAAGAGPAIDFASAAGPDAGLATKILSWFATPTVATSFFVEPLATEQIMAFNGNATQTYGVYSSAANQNAAGAFAAPVGFLGHYNNNEGFQSSLATTSVTCLGVLTRETLLGDLNAPWSANGGWGAFQQTVAANPAAATGSLVYKMESTSAAGKASFITREPVL